MTLLKLPAADLLTTLAAHAAAADAEPVWPTSSWDLVRESEALRWSIPATFGGLEWAGADVLRGYESLASACLTSCFILTQRDGAVRRIVASGNEELCHELLPPLAQGATFATVGLSQLTTSRQHGRPVFTARQDGDAFVFDGTVPWVTGASQAEHIVIGAGLDDGRQALAVLPRDRPGVSVGPPLELLALEGSLTAEVRCEQVRLERRWLLAGPVEKVMQGDRGGAGGLTTSSLALGLAAAAVSFLQREAQARPALAAGAERLAKTLHELREQMYRLAAAGLAGDAATALRARANTLVVQATQAALIASKGTGFVRPHPAQRWVRQAMFFLVWSCPWPAASATLDYLTFSPEQECAGGDL
jgi:alkylation response protein AidB-like acyl-CoA dehydrogenase